MDNLGQMSLCFIVVQPFPTGRYRYTSSENGERSSYSWSRGRKLMEEPAPLSLSLSHSLPLSFTQWNNYIEAFSLSFLLFSNIIISISPSLSLCPPVQSFFRELSLTSLLTSFVGSPWCTGCRWRFPLGQTCPATFCSTTPTSKISSSLRRTTHILRWWSVTRPKSCTRLPEMQPFEKLPRSTWSPGSSRRTPKTSPSKKRIEKEKKQCHVTTNPPLTHRPPSPSRQSPSGMWMIEEISVQRKS